jgi:hypothetical protein
LINASATASTNAFSCALQDDFLIDVTEVVVRGPQDFITCNAQGCSDVQRTCVSGQQCEVTSLIGRDLSDADSIIVMETCATNNGLAFYLPALDFVSDSGSTVSWGTLPITATGGAYRLCWCASGFSCSSQESHVIDVGGFQLIGPSLGIARTCVSGQTCSFDGIAGHMLSNGDSVMVLDTCGVFSTTSSTDATTVHSGVGGFPAAGLVSALVTSGATFSWGTSMVSAAGGQYRLCWCANGFQCLLGAHFRVDLGRLDILGRSALSSRTCVSGQTCRVDALPVVDGSDNDRFMVLETCGSSSLVDGFPSYGVATTERSGAAVSWGANGAVSEERVTAWGGLYRLCWCAGSGLNSRILAVRRRSLTST